MLKEAQKCFRNTFIKNNKSAQIKRVLLTVDICNDSFPKIVVS